MPDHKVIHRTNRTFKDRSGKFRSSHVRIDCIHADMWAVKVSNGEVNGKKLYGRVVLTRQELIDMVENIQKALEEDR